MLFLELSRIRFDKKDKVKDFNLLNRISDKPAESIQVELYIVGLPPPIAMLVKSREKRTLAENFLEAIIVEKDFASISSHQGNEENKSSSSEKSIKKNKGIPRSDSEKTEKEPTDMESMQRFIMHLTNEIINLKKNNGEGKKPFKPFMKNRTDFAPQIPPTSGINIEDYAMDNYCHTHHANHFERTFPEFINSFIALLTPPEPPKREKRNKEEHEEDQDEEEEEEGEEPPSHLNLLWDEEEFRDDEDDYIMEEGCIGNDYNLRSKGAPKTNETPFSSKKNNTNSTSKQAFVDKSPEKEKEKEKEK